ncbi:MAG: hypothetical protein MJ224_02035 [archaeon]|nr:hypothetical protein [archaeon]
MNYEVTIKETKGVCDTELFKTMCKNGDVTADKVCDSVGKIVSIKGYALCHIKVDKKEFDINYYATDEGYISSGSEVFLKSVKNYLGMVEMFKVCEVKTSKGTTYKATPILTEESTGEVFE